MSESQPCATTTTGEFMSRMEGDTQTRRREKFINELSANATRFPTVSSHSGTSLESVPHIIHCAEKHPNFKPSMLEPPKPKFKAVSLEGGPIVKEHSRRNTGLETKRPHQWGPLGGYY